MEKGNLIENIRDFFKEKYNGIKASESFLSFEPVGSPIDFTDFLDSEGNISEAKANEELSIIGDRLPEINDLFFSNTSRLSSAYSLLIDTSEFNTGLMEEGVLSNFAQMKSDAIAKLEFFENSSLKTPQGRYLSVLPSIKKWYDPEGSFWKEKTFSIEEKDKSKSTNGNETPSKLKALNWRKNFITNPSVLKSATNHKTPKKQIVYNAKIAHLKPALLNLNLITNSTAKPQKKLTRLKLKANKKQGALALKKRNEVSLITNVQWNNLSLLKHLSVSERLQFTGQIALADTADLKKFESDHFKMSFEYCIVNIDRPWLDRILFDVPEWWYCKSLEKGFFSNGKKDETNEGILKCYTTAMILIKDLEVSAAWSDEDKANAKDSIALGNFNISDSEFHGNTLKCKGIQIIGWMCNVLPELPLVSSPQKIKN
ncbi:MAG: hypothetical protein EVB11_09095 [Winogradskyella sp.]|nr:MAG: hypothetical protein EVB11_09095 [Winogradskyella sp.]